MALRLISILAALPLTVALLEAADDAADPETAAPAESAADGGAPAELNPLGLNGACYVCHIPFVKEDLAKTHLAQGISCAKCHGLSDKHANDEDVGATKPDITFRREQVDASCEKCHTTHDAPATKVIARFQERKLKPQVVPVCTDCHGHHRIDRSAER
jgi:RNase P subunit RPR2